MGHKPVTLWPLLRSVGTMTNMSWLQFIAELIKSLAWPATVLTLVILFRNQLGRILLKLTKLKYKDLELDFERELKLAEKDAKAIDIAPQRRSIAAAKTDSAALLRQAEELAPNYPAPSVSVAWQAVEYELKQVVTGLGITDNPADLSPFKLVGLLRRQDAIDTPTADLLDRMRYLRNLTAHREVSITTDNASEYLSLARGVVEKLRSLHR
jgi:hypothetical protein